MQDRISLKVVTPERIIFEDAVASVTAMTQEGEITVLPGHVPLVANLRSGEMRIRQNGEEYFLVASTGFIEVRGNSEVVVLADTAERAEELDLEKIEQAKAAAQHLLEQQRNRADVAFADAAVHLERELARYRVAQKYRRFIKQR